MIITKFEQSGFTLKVGYSRYAFDIGSLTSSETVASLGELEASFTSHIHPDHFVPSNLSLMGAPIFGPAEAVLALGEEGIEARALSWSNETVVGDIVIRPVACDHGPLDQKIENMGFLIRACGLTIYFVGDMAVPTPGFADSCDLVLVPVGGGKVFNPDQALAYLRTFNPLGPVVPTHYHGRADPESGEIFRRLAGDDFDVRVLDPGESIELR